MRVKINKTGGNNVAMADELQFRYAERKDTDLIFKFIKELAECEKMLDEVIADEATL